MSDFQVLTLGRGLETAHRGHHQNQGTDFGRHPPDWRPLPKQKEIL